MWKKNISLVFPVFNEEKNIFLIYKEVLKNFEKISFKYNLEIIFINDWSFDSSWLKIQEICKKDKNVKWINLSRNFWQQNAFLAWLKLSSWDAIITLDSDFQDPIFVAFEMIKKWEEGYEIVYWRRKIRKDWILKNYTAKIYYKIFSKISSIEIPENVGDFRLIDKKVLVEFLKLTEQNIYLRWIFPWLWFKIFFIDFERPERKNWKTWYSPIKMLRLAMDWILSFSMFPLRIGFLIWFLIIIFSLFSVFYMLFDFKNFYFYHFLLVLLFFLLWLLFVFIWIVWEYVWRIYNWMKNRPNYIISEKINFNENE